MSANNPPGPSIRLYQEFIKELHEKHPELVLDATDPVTHEHLDRAMLAAKLYMAALFDLYRLKGRAAAEAARNDIVQFLFLFTQRHQLAKQFIDEWDNDKKILKNFRALHEHKTPAEEEEEKAAHKYVEEAMHQLHTKLTGSQGHR